MSRSPPLRFLVMVLGGWAAMRAAWLAPPGPAPSAGAAAAARTADVDRPAVRPKPRETPQRPARALPGRKTKPFRMASAGVGARPTRLPSTTAEATSSPPTLDSRGGISGAAASPPSFPAAPGAPAPAAAGRWSLSAWAFVRRGGGAALAAGGLLGGSQAGARLTYRLGGRRALALSARIAAPLRSPAGAEAALGLDWQPSRRLPLHLLAERRQKLGREGRSAFGVTLYGGVSEAPLGRFRIDAYAQAGLVGTRSRDLFGDGALRISLPLGGRARLGAGAWAAAQPGVARLDLGPQAALRLPVPGRNVSLAADWRLRVAGNARPGSGPSLTLATDF